MLRIMGLALILAVAAAPTAAADDGAVAPGIRQNLPLVAAAQPAQRQVAGVPILPQATLRAHRFAGQRQVDVGPARLMPERRRSRQRGLVLPWRSQGRSALALPLTDRLALGVGYHRVQGEDLWREFAEIGGMDYESHNVLLRAHWRF